MMSISNDNFNLTHYPQDKSLVSRNEIFNGDVVNPKTILDHFGEWLKANDDTQYDFAVLLTG